MANVAHSTLTGADLHEPKGAAAATIGQVYIADGAGSGDWISWPSGWGYYLDGAAAQTFTSTDSKLSIDGTGVTSDTSRLPKEIRGVSELWNTTTDFITPISVGDAYSFRIDLPVTAKSGTPTEITVTLDIGGAATATIPIVYRNYVVTRTPPYTISVVFDTFTGQQFKAAGGQLFVKTDTGTIDILDPAIFIVRTHSGDI